MGFSAQGLLRAVPRLGAASCRVWEFLQSLRLLPLRHPHSGSTTLASFASLPGHDRLFARFLFRRHFSIFPVLWVVAPSRVARSVPLRVFLVGPPRCFLVKNRPLRDAGAAHAGSLAYATLVQRFIFGRACSQYLVLVVGSLECSNSGQPCFSPVLLVCFWSTRRAKSVCLFHQLCV